MKTKQEIRKEINYFRTRQKFYWDKWLNSNEGCSGDTYSLLNHFRDMANSLEWVLK